MHRKEGLMFKNMGQTYADMKKLHEEAAGMPLEDIFMNHLNKPIETQDVIAALRAQLEEARIKLSRYEQAVEVEGAVYSYYEDGSRLEVQLTDKLNQFIGHRVKVLVMPIVEEGV